MTKADELLAAWKKAALALVVGGPEAQKEWSRFWADEAQEIRGQQYANRLREMCDQ